MAIDLDKKDVEILKTLRKDSRTPMGMIGENNGMSKATVSRRVARMEEEGLIQKYSLKMDHEKFNIMRSMVQIQIMGAPVSMVIEGLKNIEEIRRIFKTFGDHNLICEVYTNSVDELYEMVQSKILKMPSVRNVEVDVIVGEDIMHENADLIHYENKMKEEGPWD